jgi:hypothetical protein
MQLTLRLGALAALEEQRQAPMVRAARVGALTPAHSDFLSLEASPSIGPTTPVGRLYRVRPLMAILAQESLGSMSVRIPRRLPLQPGQWLTLESSAEAYSKLPGQGA